MAPKKHNLDLSYLRDRIQIYQAEGKDVLYTAIFITDKLKDKIVDRASPKQLAHITKSLKYVNPDKIRVELYDGKEAKNMLWFTEYELNKPELETKQPTTFQGFGEAEINSIVDQRFRERKQQEEFVQLKEQVTELTTELDEQRNLVEELETENERLEKVLESKTQVRYYAGMLGDILESFGIAKSKVKSPLATLMGVTDVEEKEEQIQYTRKSKPAPTENTEQIQTFTFNEQGRNEIITLMSEYLKNVDDQILGEVFTIFSDIEKTPERAKELIHFLQSK